MNAPRRRAETFRRRRRPLTHGANASPERGVEQDHVDRALQHVRGELFEVDDHGVGGERDAQPLARVTHAGEAEHRVLEVVVVEIFDRAAETDGLFGRPDRVGIEAEGIPGKRGGERAIALEIVAGREDTPFQLVRTKPVLLLQCLCLRDDLLGRAHGALAVCVGVAKEQVGRKRHAIANAPAENLADRHAPRLAEEIETGELERRDHLGAVVVEGGGRVREQEAHVFEPRRIAPDE